jgi:acyl carrier protein
VPHAGPGQSAVRQSNAGELNDMDSGSVKEKVLDMIREKALLGDEIGLDSKVGHEFGKDSLDRTDLVMEFEDEFDIAIPDEMESKLKNVGDIVKYIEEQVKGR